MIASHWVLVGERFWHWLPRKFLVVEILWSRQLWSVRKLVELRMKQNTSVVLFFHHSSITTLTPVLAIQDLCLMQILGIQACMSVRMTSCPPWWPPRFCGQEKIKQIGAPWWRKLWQGSCFMISFVKKLNKRHNTVIFWPVVFVEVI